MNVRDRIIESEQKFELKKQEREQHIQAAEECLTEMAKLQGEWRLLQEMLQEQQNKKELNQEATTITAEPEKEGK